MFVYIQNHIGKQCLCTHKHEKTPEPQTAERVLFSGLLELCPQSPCGQNVLGNTAVGSGYAILQITNTVNFFTYLGNRSVVLLLWDLCRRSLW